jgi:lysophospholipase L1-like esterase
VSAAQKAASEEAVRAHIESALEFGFQNPAALIPFYEVLYRHKQGEPGPVRILHFGDSHTAADEWPGALRTKLQSDFGSGGPGFVQAGRPYAGFRRLDTKATMSRGWEPAGLLQREGDGLNGLAGISLRASGPGETLTLEAEGESLQVFFYRQPGGGSMSLSVDGAPVDTIDTAGEAGAGFYERKVAPGLHSFGLRTTGGGEVRVFGWVVENGNGVTWETLGINGAQADLLLGWNADLLRSHIEKRDPALIVLAYGTNEARRSDWTYETYRAAFTELLAKLRSAAPAASILVVGPPDQSLRQRGKWVPAEGVDRILQAQRDAAISSGAAFWNTRSGMGGKGSMKQWVYAGLAQGDFVHLTSPGYRLLGESLYGLMMDTYSVFATFRRQASGSTIHGSSSQDR